jgi:hypothetical protein
MERRLTSCKKYLSRYGRLTLIKGMLSSLPTYFFSLFPLPRVARRLERLQRDFLLDGIGDEPKFHMVNWRTVCSSVPRGGEMALKSSFPKL